MVGGEGIAEQAPLTAGIYLRTVQTAFSVCRLCVCVCVCEL